MTSSVDMQAVQRRLRLAYVSPVAPQPTGISEYSGELLPQLARFYDIDVITQASEVTDPWVRQNAQVHGPEWLRAHGHEYDRVLYHVGNSSYHEFMFDLLREQPGVVVLHDFHLGNIHRDMQARDPAGRVWNRALHESHGYRALAEALDPSTAEAAAWKYPANLPVLEAARGVIVHSRFAQQLARDWFGAKLAQRMAVVPLLRVPAAVDAQTRAQARHALGVAEDDFLVCSFGLAGPLKLSDRILDAWTQSSLARDPRCRLLFVGGNDAGSYGEALAARVAAEGAGRVRITGRVDARTYRRYLEAADLAVQLRAQTRGETSAAALDCLNFQLPTIVNAHGALADLPRDVAHHLPDEFTTQQLVDAIETLRSDAAARRQLCAAAGAYVARVHAPEDCARACMEAIESFYAAARDSRPSSSRRLLVDVSAIRRQDLKSGIQRVVRSVLKALVDVPPAGYRVEPMYLSDEGGRWHARYARRYMLGLLGVPAEALDDEPAQLEAGDVFLGVDLSGGFVVAAEREQLFSSWRAKGVGVCFVVHDLLPLQMPDKFPPEEIGPFRAWLDVVARADAVLGVSATVAGQFSEWRAKHAVGGPAPFVGHFHHGADIAQSAPTRGRPDNHIEIASALQCRRTFLVVGTIEPRKGHAQILAALERLWSDGVEWNLVFVGRQGWMVDSLIRRIREHPQLGRRLFWLHGISDEFLEEVYSLASCLLFASEGEGFGLPLIEAAQHGLPIVARELPVFREVAGPHAFYFTGLSPRALAGALEQWIQLYRHGLHPRSDGMKWQTWRDTTEQIKQALARAGLLRPALT